MIWKLQTFFSAHDLYYKFFQIRNSLHVSIIQLILECSMSSDCCIMWRLLMSSDCCIMQKHLMSSDCCICSTFMVAYLLIVCFTHRSSSVPLMAADVTTCPTPGEAKCMSWWIAPTSCGGVWIIDLSMVLWSICIIKAHFVILTSYTCTFDSSFIDGFIKYALKVQHSLM